MSTATIRYPSSAASQRRRPRPVAGGPTAERGTAASEAWGSTRLTRRGRLVVLAASIGIAVGGVTLVSGPADSTSSAHHAAAEQVVVEPGQTLWDIAQQVAPGVDTRTVIDEIVDLNSLASAGDIRAGQPLYVPEY